MEKHQIDSDRYSMADFFESEDPDLFAKTLPLKRFIDDWQKKGTYTYRRVIKSAPSNRATVWCHIKNADHQAVMLASNNYLGLNTRREVVHAATRALEKYGTSMCGAPFLNGTYDLLTELEDRLARFEHCEAAMVFTTGYQTNLGTIGALMRAKDLVLMDRLSHASIVDGCRLAGCTVRSFKHNNVPHLEALLKKNAHRYKGKLIVVEGVFSMDGDRAPLSDIVRVARTYGARVLVDEAHATGVLGKTGRGTVEHFNLHGHVDLVVGTFSKTLASTGGFVAGSAPAINYIRHFARSYIFSASPTPPNVAAALKALEIVEREPELRDRLWQNIHYFHRELKKRGFTVCPDPPQSAVIAVVIGSDIKLRKISRAIHEAGVFLNSVVYPAVRKNFSRLRISLSACHTREDLDYSLEVLANTGREYGII